MHRTKVQIEYVSVATLKPAAYNPRTWDENAKQQLKESLSRFDVIDPLIVNGAAARRNTVIGGHFRLEVAKELGYTEVPVVYVDIPEIQHEQELNLRLNRNTGEFDWNLLAEFDQQLLDEVGFSDEELGQIFDLDDDSPEVFDLEKELAKLDIKTIEIEKGDIWQIGDNRLMCGDSTNTAHMLALMDGKRADMCLTDPPYILDYLHGRKNAERVTGFGYKRDRRYLETDVLPPDFTAQWVASVHAVQQPNFSIIVYENWKNLRTIWGELEQYWKVKNMLVWHLPNRHQNFAARHKFFSKHDIAVVGASGDVPFNTEEESDGLQEEYETALYAISGQPQWTGYKKGNSMPTDFIEFRAEDEKHSGQAVVFGTKPLEILIPYIKVLTKRGDLIVEPFGGSGSTGAAALKLRRRCYTMEKSPIYAEVIRKRWERLAGAKATKIGVCDAARA